MYPVINCLRNEGGESKTNRWGETSAGVTLQQGQKATLLNAKILPSAALGPSLLQRGLEVRKLMGCFVSFFSFIIIIVNEA